MNLVRIPDNVMSVTLDYYWTKTYPGEGNPSELFIVALTSLVVKESLPGSGGGTGP